ncbi:MAG: Ig-like domain-containing protein, partial [Abditibacteriales bacterium]|nr:Ig-like domain-containing protein [Abditibacteriales bacterium]MDW8368346.1 hypothetical protein [Abditibacteriales bacterium]
MVKFRMAYGILRVACCVSAGLLLLLGSNAHSQRSRSQISMRLRPDEATVPVGSTVQFRAEVRGTPNQVVHWSVVGKGQGTINERGLYTAPSTITTPAVVTVRAVSDADPAVEATATVRIPEVSVSVSPTQTQALAGSTVQLTAKVSNAGRSGVRWEVDGGSGNGTVSSTGLFTLPSVLVTPATLTVRAISVADPTKSATAKISVPPVSISVEPSRADVPVGGSKQFRAHLKNTKADSVLWEVVGGAESGTISDSGLYTAPPSAVTPATVLIRAVSDVDPTKFAFAQINLPPVSVEVSPSPPKDPKRSRGIGIRTMRVVHITLPFDPVDSLIRGPLFRGRSGKLYIPVGGSYQFYATVSGTPQRDVKWSLEGVPPLGSISESGLYIAPSSVTTPKTVVVKATAVADPTKTALTYLTIPPVVLRVEPPEAEVLCGDAKQFKAIVDNTENDAVRWSVVGGEENGSISDAGLYMPPPETTTPKT